MQPRHIDDFMPLLDMKEPVLREVAAMTANEYGVIPEKNRIYYLSKELRVITVDNIFSFSLSRSDRISAMVHCFPMQILSTQKFILTTIFFFFQKIAPVTVSKYCSKFELIFFASFIGIAKKLNILLDYNVDGKQILQSLYIFRCADKVIISRLEELFANGVYDIKFWIFKCTEEKFRK